MSSFSAVCAFVFTNGKARIFSVKMLTGKLLTVPTESRKGNGKADEEKICDRNDRFYPAYSRKPYLCNHEKQSIQKQENTHRGSRSHRGGWPAAHLPAETARERFAGRGGSDGLGGSTGNSLQIRHPRRQV